MGLSLFLPHKDTKNSLFPFSVNLNKFKQFLATSEPINVHQIVIIFVI